MPAITEETVKFFLIVDHVNRAADTLSTQLKALLTELVMANISTVVWVQLTLDKAPQRYWAVLVEVVITVCTEFFLREHAATKEVVNDYLDMLTTTLHSIASPRNDQNENAVYKWHTVTNNVCTYLHHSDPLMNAWTPYILQIYT